MYTAGQNLARVKDATELEINHDYLEQLSQDDCSEAMSYAESFLLLASAHGETGPGASVDWILRGSLSSPSPPRNSATVLSLLGLLAFHGLLVVT